MRQSIHFVHTSLVIPPLNATSREVGACVDFQGLVRATEGDSRLDGLHYEAHETMACTLLTRHFAELATLHPCESVTFIHRLGWVPVGESSLFLRVPARHRGPAISFCVEAIDRMKADVPIWKVSSDLRL